MPLCWVCVQVSPELFVDTSRNEKMRINLDITFQELPCACKLLWL